MKVFPIHVRIFPFRWRLYCNVCAVDRSDYIGKTGYLCKLRFDVCLVYCIIDSDSKIQSCAVKKHVSLYNEILTLLPTLDAERIYK